MSSAAASGQPASDRALQVLAALAQQGRAMTVSGRMMRTGLLTRVLRHLEKRLGNGGLWSCQCVFT